MKSLNNTKSHHPAEVPSLLLTTSRAVRKGFRAEPRRIFELNLDRQRRERSASIAKDGELVGLASMQAGAGSMNMADIIAVSQGFVNDFFGQKAWTLREIMYRRNTESYGISERKAEKRLSGGIALNAAGTAKARFFPAQIRPAGSTPFGSPDEGRKSKIDGSTPH